MTTVGQQAVYRLASSRYMQALVTKIVSGNTIELVAYSDGSAWGDGDPASLGAKLYESVALGTGVGEWQPGTLVGDAVTAGVSGLATAASVTAAIGTCEGYCDTAIAPLATSSSVTSAIAAAIAGIPADDDSALCAVPGASSTVSLAASTPRRPSTTRPVMVMLTGSWSWNLTALGTQTGSLSLQSDSISTPSAVIYAPAWSRGITVGITVGDAGTMPVCASYLVPPGHYYQVIAAGGATFSIREQVM